MEVRFATFGVWELVLILLIVVVIFGVGKLPQLGDSLGKSIRNFRKSFKGEPKEVQGEARRLEPGAQPEKLPTGQNAEPVAQAQEKAPVKAAKDPE